jgi:hypothetical protein
MYELIQLGILARGRSRCLKYVKIPIIKNQDHKILCPVVVFSEILAQNLNINRQYFEIYDLYSNFLN